MLSDRGVSCEFDSRQALSDRGMSCEFDSRQALSRDKTFKGLSFIWRSVSKEGRALLIRLVVCILLRNRGFDPRTVHVGFPINKVEFYRVFSKYTSISSVVISKIILVILPSSEGQAGEELETSNKAIFFHSYEALQTKTFHIVSIQKHNDNSNYTKKGEYVNNS